MTQHSQQHGATLHRREHRDGDDGRQARRGDPTDGMQGEADPVSRRHRAATLLVLSLGLALGLAPRLLHAEAGAEPAASQVADEEPTTTTPQPVPSQQPPSAQRQVGWASYYHARFSGRSMADGTPMRAGSDSAASKTLPLGTTARVTNLHNGRSAIVTIRDRGPHAKGRIIDVSIGTAGRLGMTRSGVAQVEVVALR